MSKKVLIVGFDPHKIAFGPERGLTSEGVAATGQATTDKLSGLWLERKRSCQLESPEFRVLAGHEKWYPAGSRKPPAAFSGMHYFLGFLERQRPSVENPPSPRSQRSHLFAAKLHTMVRFPSPVLPEMVLHLAGLVPMLG